MPLTQALSDPLDADRALDVPYRTPKRFLDTAVAGTLLLLSSPVVLVVGAAMAVDMAASRRDRGPFLYRERRISKGRVFDLLKLRTLQRDVLAEMEAAGGHARLYEADPTNLTWTGRRMLKPWYLDELPQLLNVLRGDISLVGPRPWPPEMVDGQVDHGQTYRKQIVAGLTGPAQVTKGGGQRYEDLDLEYVRLSRTLGSWALLRYDVGILAETVRVIARGEGLNF
jgi:lipopolysaccharide/colanic/teichoic acid biosynthesis glycosyltransferase